MPNQRSAYDAAWSSMVFGSWLIIAAWAVLVWVPPVGHAGGPVQLQPMDTERSTLPKELEMGGPLPKESSDDLPGGTVPGGTVPGGTLPGGTVPGGTVPGGTLPGGTVPGGTVPGGTLPGGTVPGGTVPGGTVPGGTVPG